MRVLAWTPRLEAGRRGDVEVARDLEQLLAESDYVSLHAPATPETTGLIGERELRAMKPTAYLVNTSRGALVDEDALVRALREGWIAGAALDVLRQEPPPPDHPLLALDNAIVTPHAAFYSDTAIVELQTKAATNVANVLTGALPATVVNPRRPGARGLPRRAVTTPRPGASSVRAPRRSCRTSSSAGCSPPATAPRSRSSAAASPGWCSRCARRAPRVVAKQALPRLRVEDDWRAKLERTEIEAAAMRLCGRLTPGRVPAVLDLDPGARRRDGAAAGRRAELAGRDRARPRRTSRRASGPARRSRSGTRARPATRGREPSSTTTSRSSSCA